MKLNEHDFESLTNLRALRDANNKMHNLESEIHTIKSNIEKYLQNFINTNLFSINELEKIDQIIAEKDIHKFEIFGIKFSEYKSLTSISAILEQIFKEKRLSNMNHWLCNSYRKLEYFVNADNKYESRVVLYHEPHSVFVDTQNKKIFLIPSRNKIITHIGNSHLILFSHRITMTRPQSYEFNHFGISTLEYTPLANLAPNDHLYNIYCVIDIETLKVNSSEKKIIVENEEENMRLRKFYEEE